MTNNRNTVGTGMDGILRFSLGIKPMQLVAVRGTITTGIGRFDINKEYGEAWSETGEISQVGHNPESIGINNSATIIEKLGSVMR